MPKLPARSASPKPARRVVLVEEYGALAVAIGSALRKFAPDAEIDVVGTFAEALALGTKARPTLFVVDFDPPQSGAIKFFDQLRVEHSQARALVLAAGTAREITAIRGSAGAIQYTEKPFELAEFGAAVQALLGPWNSEDGAARGTLSDLGLADLLPLVCLAGSSSELKVTGELHGEIQIRRGQIINAQCAGRSGADALAEMMGWRDVAFAETTSQATIAPTLSGPWAAILSEAIQRSHERTPRRVKSPTTAVPPPPRVRTGKKIVVIDDTEMLLIFVEDTLAQTNDDFQITTASSGISGVSEVQRIAPDLVLLDYSLPDIDGREVAARLRADERTKRVPIVMMSGHVPEMTSVAMKSPNIIATIAKPFRSDALLRIVAGAIEQGPLPEIVDRPAPLEPKLAAPVEALPEVVEVKAPALEPEPIAAIPAAVKADESPEILSPAPPLAPVLRNVTPLPASPPRNDLGAAETRVLLALPLQISGMQFTPSFQIASVRTTPAAAGVSLQLVGSTSLAALPVKKRFHLGPVMLDGSGHLQTVSLDSTMPVVEQNRSARGTQGQASLSEDAGYFAPGISQPMTMQLIIPLDLASIQLSSFFEISQLVLKCHGEAVRGTLNGRSDPAGQNGATFRVSAILLDAAQRISELTLVPAGS